MNIKQRALELLQDESLRGRVPSEVQEFLRDAASAVPVGEIYLKYVDEHHGPCHGIKMLNGVREEDLPEGTKLYATPAVPVESLGREAAPYSAPFTTDVRNCCESPETCPEPCGVPPASVPESPEDRFEQFVQAEIARSPKPLQDLGEYLARVLDEDKFPAANRLLLQLAVEHKTTPPPANVPDGACPRCNGEKEGYLLDGDGPYLCNACYDTPPTTPEESP